MKNKFIIYLVIICAFMNFIKSSFASEFTFNTSEITITDKGDTINAIQGIATSSLDNVSIDAKKFIYKKKLSLLEAVDGIATASDEGITIKADKILYNQDSSTITATGNVEINDLTNKIIVKSQNIFYNINQRIISSETNSNIKDKLGNIITIDKFFYTLNDGIIKLNYAKILDIEKNLTQVEIAYLNLTSNKLIGKDISIDFNNVYFQKNSEPRLKGNMVSKDENELIIKKGIFTTCKKNDDCPPWELSAEEIRHNKEKKTIYYKNAWLKLYDKPVFYFPKFFHPDPTVKRQSGFLMPSFTQSSNKGSAFNLPYYKVISDNKDLTISPKFYADDKLLIQSEYRQVNLNSKHTLDFSAMAENNNSLKSHFFSNTIKKLDFSNFDESQLSLQIQTTSNDKYLKTHKLKSPIIDDLSLLKSSLEISAYREDLTFNTKFEAYENLNNSDNKYEFVYPSFDILKQFNDSDKLNGDFFLNTTGYLKNYNTNTHEAVLINDFTFNSHPSFTDLGFKNNYNFMIKNVNTDSQKSSKYKDKANYQLGTIIEYNSTYPMIKTINNYTSILKPMTSIMFSPNKSKNMRDEDKRIDINNIFSLERLGVNDSLEGGTSFTYGIDYSKTDQTNKKIVGVKIANSLKLTEDKKLPGSSHIGKKTSDFVGNLNYSPNKFFNTNYDFSIDENFSDINYQLLGFDFKVNNFITTFEYLNENHTINGPSYLTNKTELNIDGTNKLLFSTRENKKNNFTEFYNLIYQYRNDCLIAALEYNKDYYNDGDIKPEESILFRLTIMPFGQASSPNFKQ